MGEVPENHVGIWRGLFFKNKEKKYKSFYWQHKGTPYPKQGEDVWGQNGESGGGRGHTKSLFSSEQHYVLLEQTQEVQTSQKQLHGTIGAVESANYSDRPQ